MIQRNMKFLAYRLMQAALEGAAAGGGEPPPGAPNAGDSPAAPAAAPAAAVTSALAPTGEPAAAVTPHDWVPEKFRVVGDDGALNLEESAKKLAEAYAPLEKRMGSGDAPPKTAAEYTITVPDALKDAFNPDDESFQSARTDLHALGLTQKQFDGVMAEYFKRAPGLVAGGLQLNAEQCIAELNKVWTDPATSKANFQHALVGATKLGEIAGVSMAEIESSGLANNPAFIKMMAKLGPEMSEDVPPTGAASLQTQSGVKELMASDAYKDHKHPQHAETVAKVRAYHNRMHGSTPVV